MNRLELEQQIREVIKNFEWAGYGLSSIVQNPNDEWVTELAYDIAERIHE